MYKIFKRENYLKKIRGFYHNTEIIKVITGVRRCGKSSLMEIIKSELIEKGIPTENIIYLDMDSRKYRKIKSDTEFENLIESMSVAAGKKYLFVDEIQNVTGFEEVINAFRGKIINIHPALIPSLFEMFPLSFEEYLEIKNFYGQEINANLIIELNNYLLEGGFPKTIQYETLADKRTYVKSVIDEIFEKDIRQRVKIRNKEVFEKVRNYILNNFGATTNPGNIIVDLSKIGLNIKRETLNRYIKALTDAKILYECDRFDLKSRKSIAGDKKYYLADTSFYFACNTDNRINYGPALENIVYVYARSKDYSVSIGRIGKLECDFIFRDSNLNYSYVQVAYTINESRATEDREYSPLEKIRDNYPKYVMTADYILQNRNGIRHINLMEFMKNNEMFYAKTAVKAILL